MNFFHIS